MIKFDNAHIARIDLPHEGEFLCLEYREVGYEDIGVYSLQSTVTCGGGKVVDVHAIDLSVSTLPVWPQIERPCLNYSVSTSLGEFKGLAPINKRVELVYDKGELVNKKITEYADHPENFTHLTYNGDPRLASDARHYVRELDHYVIEEVEANFRQLLDNLRAHNHSRHDLLIPHYFSALKDVRLIGEDTPIHEMAQPANAGRLSSMCEKLEAVLASILEK